MIVWILLTTSLSHHIMNAKSIEELHSSKQKYWSQQYNIQLCEKQLKHNQFPKNCYKISNLNNAPEFLSYLSEKCQNLKLENNSLKQLSSILKIPNLPSECRQMVKNQEKITKYQLRDHPELFIKENFKK